MANESQDNSPNTYERFLLYVYLSAAEADFNITGVEKDLIREKMQRSGLVSNADFDKHWHKARHDYETHNDYESEQYIEKSIDELNLDQNARQKIYDDIKDIIDTKGKEGASEIVNLYMFRKMLRL